jgi:hypothetical protein
MLLKQKHASGKTLYTSRPLLLKPAQTYVRPAETGRDWFETTTTVWHVDELVRRRVRDWRRLLGETGHTGERTGTMRADHDSIYTGTHSVFACPLVEWILLRYGGRAGGRVLDAFAGGPPRGVVSGFMGYQYHGFEIRQEQIDENLAVVKTLDLRNIHYHHADGRFLEAQVSDFDFALTCPPYWNLETYSDLHEDLSNAQSYSEFLAGISFSIESHWPLMKPGAFVCWVVGPFRDKRTGELYDFPAHVIDLFSEIGFTYWQSVVLVKNFASAAKRASNAWRNKRLVPRHEFLQVFRKPE